MGLASAPLTVTSMEQGPAAPLITGTCSLCDCAWVSESRETAATMMQRARNIVFMSSQLYERARNEYHLAVPADLRNSRSNHGFHVFPPSFEVSAISLTLPFSGFHSPRTREPF